MISWLYVSSLFNRLSFFSYVTFSKQRYHWHDLVTRLFGPDTIIVSGQKNDSWTRGRVDTQYSIPLTFPFELMQNLRSNSPHWSGSINRERLFGVYDKNKPFVSPSSLAHCYPPPFLDHELFDISCKPAFSYLKQCANWRAGFLSYSPNLCQARQTNFAYQSKAQLSLSMSLFHSDSSDNDNFVVGWFWKTSKMFAFFCNKKRINEWWKRTKKRKNH